MGKNDNKLRVNLKMDKIWQKKEEICFCWELNSKPFMMTVVGNYLENKLKMEKSAKKEEICFRWELNSKPFIMAEVGNYLENRSNDC